jgi:Uma2 family endonuclease
MIAAPAKAKIYLRPELAGIRLSAEEFDAVDDCDPNYRYELIDGRLIVTPPPLEAERGPNEELGYLLRAYREERPLGSCLDDTLPEQIVQTRANRRRADRVIWIGLGRVPSLATDLPSVVAEFVSEGKRNWYRDFMEKREEYSEIGIAEYWIFDRFRRTMTIYRRTKTGTKKIVVKEGDIYRTPLLPGFELPLARLLAVADRWAKSK